MGYDVELTGALLQAMRDAATDLGAIRTSDVQGHTAMHKLEGVTAELRDRWIPFVHGLLSCQAMSGYVPTSIADSDLVNSWMASLIGTNGWRTSTDPLSSSGQQPTSDHVAALAEWLSEHHDELDDELDDDELEHLQHQLGQILSSPTLIAAFLDHLSVEGMTGLVNQLGEARADLALDDSDGGLGDEAQSELTTVDAAIESLAGIVVAGWQQSSFESTPSELVDDIDPYAAALLVQHLHLDANQLAEIAVSLIAREWDDGFTNETYMAGVRAADVLMATILATDDGPSRFVVTAADRPQLLVLAAADAQLSDRILLAGTLPAVLSDAEQAHVIPSIVHYIDDTVDWGAPPNGEYQRDIVAVAAAVMAPYMVKIFKADGGFGLDEAEREKLWDFVVDNEATVQYFAEERDRLLLAFSEPLGADFYADQRVLRDLAVMLGLLDALYVQGRVDVAAQRQADWDFAWSAAGLLTGVFPFPAVGGVAADFAVIGAQQVFESVGWAPAEIDQVRSDAVADSGVRSAIIAAIVIRSTFDSFVEQGRIPASVVPPPVPDTAAEQVGLHYVSALADWATDAGLDDGTTSWLLLASTTLLNPYTAGATAFAKYDDDD